MIGRGAAMCVVLLLVACGSTNIGPVSPAPAGSSGSCDEAFKAAAGVDRNADSVADLYPAARACSTIAAWSAAFEANGGAGFSGSATEVLVDVCSATEIEDEPLCELLP